MAMTKGEVSTWCRELAQHINNDPVLLRRFRDKGGVEDLKKARHYIDKLIEVEGAK